MNDELLKRIDSLEKRTKELESKLKNNLAMFGRSYSLIGDSNSDFLIKTRGQVKIQWGNKFIDLIKDGKINADSNCIFTAKSADKLGSKDGIYVVGGKEVYLKIGDSTINIIGEVGNTFVSFMEGLLTTSDAKYNAMVNIGFIYESLDKVDNTSLLNGIIYIESELKLFLVRDGNLSEFKVNISNPFTLSFVIQKNDSSKGALVIKGTGSDNSVAFDSFLVYTEFDNGVIDAENGIIIKVGESDKITIDNFSVKVDADLITNMVKSPLATSDRGFRLYYMNNESVLEVDRIIERSSRYNSDEDSSTIIYPEYWLLNNRIIKEAVLQKDTSEDQETSTSTNTLYLTLSLDSTYKVGDILCVYKQQQEGESSHTKVELEVTNVSKNGREIQAKCSPIDKADVKNLVGKFIFQIKSSDNKVPVRIKSNNIDIVEYKDKSEDIRNETIKTRIGDLTDIIGTLEYGVYSNKAYFDNILYMEGYDLPLSDNSSKIASTEWVNKKFSSQTVKIDFSVYTEDVNVKDYFSQLEIWKLYIDQKVNTTVTYSGLFGIITISKSNNEVIFSAIVRAITDTSTWSHRSINGTFDLLTSLWYGTSTYIIVDKVNPGYYWAKEIKNNFPVSPEYIGTTDLGFEISENKPFLLYTNDGKLWSILKKYIPPLQDKIYILSTNISSNTETSTGISSRWPGGFLCYCKDGKSVTINFGKSNYIPVESTINDSKDIPLLNKLLIDAEAGNVPSKSGYFYLWSIGVEADKSKPDNWKIESSGTIEVAIVTKDSCDWGNSSTRPGYTLWKVDNDNTIISSVPQEDFVLGEGTLDKWADPIWRKSFLRTILGETLSANISNYDPELGWRFNYSGVIRSTGYDGGYWSSRIGKLLDPTSDDKENINSIPTAILENVCGLVMGKGYLVLFQFTKVKIGKELPYRYALPGYKIGDKLYPGRVKLFLTSYDKCYYRIVSDFNYISNS